MMELKITADERFLAALEGLKEAIQASMRGEVAMPAQEEPETRNLELHPVGEPDRTEPPALEEAPVSAEDVKRQAIQMIQGGKRDAVKGLLDKYGAARVGDISDDKLAEFAKDLAGLK